MPCGNVSSKFCDKCKSVKFSRPPISSGSSSNLKKKRRITLIWEVLNHFSGHFINDKSSYLYKDLPAHNTYLFSDTSRHIKLPSIPISGGNRCNWLWSSHSSCSAGSCPKCGGRTSISLSPKSRRSNLVSRAIDTGKLRSKFSRNSNDSSCVKLK